MSIQHGVVNVGIPASGFNDWETRRFHFHGFVDLTTTKGKFVKSPDFTCGGHQWRVTVFPGGSNLCDDGMVGVVLRNRSTKSIELDDFVFSVKNSHGADVANCSKRWSALSASSASPLFEPRDASSYNDSYGFNNFAKRSDILSVLVAGTLVIEVRMKMKRADAPSFVAENSWSERVLSLFMDKKTADIVFEVEGDSQKNADTRKRSRTAPVKFHAHRFVLNQSAPMLAALCPPGDDVVSASITDVAPEVFCPLLCYLYGGEVSEDDYKSHAREIIKAADRFEIVSLKLAAEAWYVRSTKIDLDNVMELLLYSDAKNLALLKEAVMDFIVGHGKDVLEKVPLNEVPAGLFADLLAAMTRGKEKATGDTGDNDFSSICISDLRRKLHEKGLGIDGSREMLIATLKRSN